MKVLDIALESFIACRLDCVSVCLQAHLAIFTGGLRSVEEHLGVPEYTSNGY